ncbi:MAG: bifunctional demethylmenaquinone methyltransferase/2-methoxy-6-polyprenyl-1,4-benzoquinol methylase UbiE [Alphaproteobacteria bacterium]|nr:bifunctional demethylmenaquinone methyltransferase/2-methoxy-6-polyprenyl-1,4-benzoquinol methylase UbiE [Alphaproteobacteria bacterium]
MIARAKDKNKESQWFGYKAVKPEEKARLVEDVFSSVASRYDLMNDLMSGGIHRLWKNRFVSMLRPSPDKSLLDVAGGTGDIAFRYRAKAGPKAKITVCDINKDMLEVGKNRALDRGYVKGFTWVVGNAETLPFDDNSFDLYTISFGLRNVPKIDDALEEACRVLKPGGRFFCLEFSRVLNPALRKLYDEYSFRIIPKIGEAVANDHESYQYLVESIRQFPPQEELARRMRKAGFDVVKVINLSGGIAAIHSGVKL